jgi:pyridoxal/pyridoxine/pyridoxamine kinase
MNEQMIFQQISQLAFQGLMQGKSEKEALDSAEATVNEIIERTKKLSQKMDK